MFKKIRLTNMRLAFFLIAILAVLMILSAIVPQQDFSREQIADWQEILGKYYNIIGAVGLDRIYYTPFFFVVLGFLGISLLYENIKRIRRAFRVRDTFSKARQLGSILFHLSIIIIIAGVIANYLYKFEGVFALTEGQTAHDNEEEYFRIYRGPLNSDSSNHFSIRLRQIDVENGLYSNANSAAELDIIDIEKNENLRARISTSNPFRLNGFEFHYGQSIGYSPKLVINNEDDHSVIDGFVRLAVQQIDGRKEHSDFIFIPETEEKIEISVLNGDLPADSALFKIIVEKNSDIIYEDTISINQEVEFGEYGLSISAIRRWCYINVVKSPYLNWIFLGFWVALAGMAIAFTGRIAGGIKKST